MACLASVVTCTTVLLGVVRSLFKQDTFTIASGSSPRSSIYKFAIGYYVRRTCGLYLYIYLTCSILIFS